MQQDAGLDSDAYLEAFMNGFEFVLLAIRGRLAEDALPADERARLEAFLADYARIVRAYQARRQLPGGRVPSSGARAFHAELEAVSAN